MSSEHGRATARNAVGVRLCLLAAGMSSLAGIEPMVTPAALWAGAVALLAISLSSLRQPLPARLPGKFGFIAAPPQVQLRQLVASVVIVVPTSLLARQAAADPRETTVATMALVVVVGQSIIVQTRRDVVVGCALVLTLLAVAAAFRPGPDLLFAFVPALIGVAATLALLDRARLLDGVAVAVSRRGAIRRALVAPIALAAVLGLVAFLAVPPGQRPQTRAGAARAGAGTTPGAGAANRFAAIGGDLDLRARGHLGDEPVLVTDVTAPAYWQGAVYDTFDGTTWTMPTGWAGLWAGAPSGTAQLQRSAVTPPPGSVVRTDAARVVSGRRLDAVFAPGTPITYSGSGRVVGDADGGARLVGAADGAAYTVTSWRPPASADALRGATGADPSDARWTQLPADLPERVTALAAQLVAGAGDRYDAVRAVEDYLRSRETYDLDSPEPALGADAVDDFLFVSHRGFCEQFATAAVVLLRSTGIPARLVTGFAAGDTTSRPGERVFRDSDAHAWVQVYYPGVGWVDSDPTASGTVTPAAASGKSLGERLAAVVQHGLRRLPGGRLTLIVTLLVGVAIGVALSWWWRRRRARRPRRREARGAGPVLTAYLLLDAALDAAGRAQAATETFAELAGRLGGLVATPTEVRAAMGTLERECYGPRVPDDAETAAAVAVFDRLREAAASQPVALARAGSG